MAFSILNSDAQRVSESIKYKSNDELNEIMNNEAKLEEIIGELDQSYLKKLENEKDNLIAENNSMAEFNLSREPQLVEGREKLRSLYDEIERLNKVIEEKLKELRSKGGDISIETALALLQTAASEMEEESEQSAKKFLANELDLDPFLDEFITKRKLMHLRLVKADKLSKILQRGDPSLNNVSNYINAPPVSINSGYFPGVPTSPPAAVPYPTGPLNMPMPPGMNYFQNHF
ncbi:vacuolar protein sorting-associated protein 37B [Cylas formicarius]|uniref:vacuolar protein sorting-associated protein 37B n=1 Tax=Cylas formicarius TaxID=197179 RepID=UPI0029588CF2|nr:vacuolar protein sorting-associated protein 37B [Cylas formicarius]